MTIHTILGCCEQCGSWTKIYVLMCRENGSEERPGYYCGGCLGKGGEVPDSLFLDISTSGDKFRPGELPAAQISLDENP